METTTIVPILKQGDYLIASVQSSLTDAEMRQFTERLLASVARHRSRGVIVDVTGLDIIDSYAARSLTDVAKMLKLRGAHMIVVGIRPDVAFAMIKFGLELNVLHTVLDLEEALAALDQRSRA